MFNIKTSVVVNAPVETVFIVLRNMAKYSAFMRYVKNVKICSCCGNEMVTKWEVDIEGADVAWEEKDIFDDKKKEMSFVMLSGDYSSYYGKWSTEPIDDKTRLSIDICVDWAIPSFERIIGPILEEKTKRVIRGMLSAIKLQAQKVNKNGAKPCDILLS